MLFVAVSVGFLLSILYAPVLHAVGPAAAASDLAESTPADPPDAPATSVTESPRADFAAIRKHLVVVKDGLDAAANEAPGFGISGQGHVLTHAGGLRDAEAYGVTNLDGLVFRAVKVEQDEKTDLLILKIDGDGHGLTALPFAKTALHPTAPLHAVTFNPSGAERFTTAAGTVTRLAPATEGYPSITHNALFSRQSAGAPLLNRCYEAVGVNVLQQRGLFGGAVDPAQQGSAQSVAAVHIRSFVESAGLTWPAVDAECLSREEEVARQRRLQREQAQVAAAEAQRREEAAQARAEQIRQEKEAAEAQAQADAEEARRREEALQAEKEAAEAQAEQVRQEKEEAEAQAQADAEEARRKEEALQAEKAAAEAQAAQARQADERKRRLLLYASLAGGALVLGVLALLFVVRAKRRRLQVAEQEKQDISGALGRAESQLSEAAALDRRRASAPDVFIESVAPQDLRIALKIPGAAIVDAPGAVVGRSPSESTFVINHEQISRRHFRLRLVSEHVEVEDLGSTNGTRVNDVHVVQDAPVPLDTGSRLGLGDLEFTVRIARAPQET